MTLFDKIKAVFGVGAATVEFDLAAEQFALGHPVAGKVKLVAGNTEQHVAVLTLKVIKRVAQAVNPEAGPVPKDFEAVSDVPEAEAPVDTSDPFPQDDSDEDEIAEEEIQIAETVLAEDLTLHRGDSRIYEFSVGLGDDGEPSTESVQWLLFARADIPGTLDATVWRRIKIVGEA